MKYNLDISSLETQTVEVRQFEHNVTTVNADFTPEDIHEDLQDLTPCVLLSVGDTVTPENGLSYIITAEKTAISWEISQEHTQRAGTFFAQFGFIAQDGTMKAYTEKFVFRVLPSVDWQKAAFEYKPGFIEAFWNKVVAKITQSIPTKLSELENDAAFVSTPDGLAEYAKTAEVNTALADYAKTTEVSAALTDYAKTTEVSAALTDYAKTTEVSAALADYAKTADIETMIEENSAGKWIHVIDGFFPESAATKSYNNMRFAPDSTSTYSKAALLYKYSDGSSVALTDFCLMITCAADCPVNADIEISINAASPSLDGETVLNAQELLVSGEKAFAVITVEKLCGAYKVSYSKTLSSTSVEPVQEKTFFTKSINSEYISSVKLAINVDSNTAATTNFTQYINAELWGVKYTQPQEAAS
ncbi:MAG: hypothetical protein PUB94_06555 [Oscillospiraceae bacterium]|nr:hypothetical protein [Oscillospiraceae bacterium]